MAVCVTNATAMNARDKKDKLALGLAWGSAGAMLAGIFRDSIPVMVLALLAAAAAVAILPMDEPNNN